MSEQTIGMQFFATLAELSGTDVVEGAEKAQCAALWHMTKWYGEAERPDDVMLLATFALKELRGDTAAIEEIKAAAKDLAQLGDDTVEQTDVIAFADAVVKVLAEAKIAPAAHVPMATSGKIGAGGGGGSG